MFSGELYDPFSEFFVAVDPELAHLQYMQPSLQGVGQLATDGGFGGGDMEDTSEEHAGGLQLWERKYQFQKDMLPAFVGETFGRKVSSQVWPVRVDIDGVVDLLYRQEFELHPIQLS